MFTSLKRKLDERRKAAEASLREVRVQSVVTALELDVSRAEVMEQTETVQQDEGVIDAFYLTQIVRNEAGEYFLLKTTDAKPYVKHLPQARAKLVLKAKYKEPGSSPS